ncbi:MAG: GNAT family N-acetyltransferase [Pyrinomonadaceae bacterium]
MTGDDLFIRYASVEDIQILAELGARTFHDAYAAESDPQEMEDYISSNFSHAQIASQINDPSTTFLLAYIGEQPIGYARLRVGHAPACVRGPEPIELVRLYLDQRVIGRGHGSALMRACLEEAARLGRQTIWLGLWELNLRARLFYERWGFKDAGTHGFVFGDEVHDDPVMERAVKEDT